MTHPPAGPSTPTPPPGPKFGQPAPHPGMPPTQPKPVPAPPPLLNWPPDKPPDSPPPPPVPKSWRTLAVLGVLLFVPAAGTVAGLIAAGGQVW